MWTHGTGNWLRAACTSAKFLKIVTHAEHLKNQIFGFNKDKDIIFLTPNKEYIILLGICVEGKNERRVNNIS